jgi:AAA domain
MFRNTGDTRRFLGAAFSGVGALRRPAATHPEPPIPDSAPSQPPPPRADLLRLTDIEHRSVEWLWQNRLAAGSVSVLSGDPGSGKTWVALAIAAALSKGETPGPNGPPDPTTDSNDDVIVPPCTVVYASPHQHGSELIRSRFLNLGGDPARLVLLRGVASSVTPGAISLSDTPVLEDALEKTGARLLILDPLHSYLATGDRDRAHGAAHLFDDLAWLAEKHRCCILLVRHLRRRGRNSTAVELSSAVRTEFLVGNNPDAPSISALVQTKSNLGPLAPSLGYRIDSMSDPPFDWIGPSKLTADDLQTGRPIGAGTPKRKLAAEWLRLQLSDGPLSQATIERAAENDGESMMTIRRAKKDIGVISTKNTFNGVWSWELPHNSASEHEELRGAQKTKK